MKNCVILVLLDIFFQTLAIPGRFYHDFYRPSSEYHGRPGSSWNQWGSSWDYHWDRHTTQRVATTPPSHHGYDVASAGYHGPKVTSPTPHPTIIPITGDGTIVYEDKANTDTTIEEAGAAVSNSSAIVTGDASLVIGEDSGAITSGGSSVATEEIGLAIASDTNAALSGEAIAEANGTVPICNNKNHDHDEGEDDDKDKCQNKNTDAPEETASTTSEPEEELVFGAAAIGSKPVPKVNDTSAPSLQWHVGIYSKAWSPYMQICGGSLIKSDVVISAAHCFWTDTTGQQPASKFAVAGGKLFRPWNSTKDEFAQRSDVSEIILPVRFRGITTSFQDDIAVLRLSTPFTYAVGVRPVCVDFDVEFERQQLVPGYMGTVAGWGLTEENGGPSQRLNFLELPYVDVDECVTSAEPAFVKYITSDKICAGDRLSGKALCRGDSGGGLVYFTGSTPYLRGVASTAAANENLCNAFTIATFTHIHAHRTFLRDNVPDIDKECPKNSAVMDLLTGNRDSTEGKEGSVTTGLPFISNYQPHASRAPYSNFFCNCNCKP